MKAGDASCGAPLLHRWVEEVADRSPESVALRFAGASLTYGELERRGNQLAHHLIRRGVRVEERVAIALERSFDMVVAALAVMKAGGAYVPVEPGHPAERIRAVVEDSGARQLISHARWADAIADVGALTIWLDDDAREWSRQPECRPRVRVAGKNLAYVIFTSGSTGRPKGVMNTHEGICNHLEWVTEALPLGAGDAVVQKTPFTFDVAVWETFWPLVSGARLVLARPEGHRDPSYLSKLFSEERVTTVHFVPSMLEAFVAAGGGGMGTVSRVICSGEALGAAHVRALAAQSRAEIVNLYGPSEAAVHVSMWRCSADEPVVPIGRPVPNVTLHVLDEELEPVRDGEEGELCIGGVQVARGYAGRPSMTAERFIPDPFGAPGARLYRTGDRARRREDGAIEYLGRLDHQVKLRGYRIELGEIEAVLEAHPRVRRAVVVVRDGSGGGKELAGYVSLAESGPTAELRAHLGERLPEYMVPAALVVMEEWPLTTSGKVDRRALPAPTADAFDRPDYVAPRSPLEETVAALWGEALGIERVGVHDDVFALGAHSLLAIRVLARIEERLGAELPLRTVFEAPTVEALAHEIERIRACGLAARRPPIQSAPRDGELPLSFAQSRAWFLFQLDPDSVAYNVSEGRRLKGSLKLEALRRAVEDIVRRHEALRTAYPASGGVPRQEIQEPGRLELPLEDLSSLGRVVAKDELERRSTEDALVPFDLQRGPLLRTRLLRLAEDEHVLLTTFHHIATDGWSMDVFWRELAALYAAHARGERAELPPLGVQYADYAVWEREWLSAERLGTLLEFWKSQLEGAPDDIELPRKARRTAGTPKTRAVSVVLGAELSGRLRELSRRRGATPFMTLMAGLRALLYRYTGQADISIGTPVANRMRPELEGVIGFFANTLVLRGEVSGDASFDQLIAREKDAALKAYSHAEAPFEAVVDAVGGERATSKNPLFQVMFAPEVDPLEYARLGDARSEPFRRPQTSKLELEIAVRDRGEDFECVFTYDGRTLEDDLVRQMSSHYAALIEALVADPSRPVADVPLLSAAETRQLLGAWNDTSRSYPSDRTVADLVAEAADQRPEAVAVRAEDETLTYSELHERSSRLAQRLRGLGVGPDVLVGVVVARSPVTIEMLLAIWKAGGAYLPIDASLPPARLTEMLEKARPPVVLVAGDGDGGVPAPAGTRVVRLAEVLQAAPNGSRDPIAAGAGPDNLAYVNFTSGSTGGPKAVGVPHRAICRLVRNNRFLAVQSGDVFLQLAPISFDASTLEIWGALANGASVALAPPGVLSLDEIARVIRDCRVSKLWLTKGLFDQMVVAHPDALAGVAHVMSGGDALSPESVRKLLRRLPEGAVFANGYGPTENTTFTTTHEMTAGEVVEDSVPIGRPISNTTGYVVDDELRPVPIGVAGELVTGGEGLARGYLADPALTAERFVPDPFSGRPGSRLYRTGDLARWRADGTLEFLGRRDHQVKVRGFRVELGEIESALERHPRVEHAVVVLRAADEDKRLVAYVVASGEEEVDVRALRAHTGQCLPDYMVPAAIVVLDELPLTPTGKIDRRALPAPNGEAYARTAHVAPRSAREQLVAGIFADVLGIESVGATDDFFSLGGHSLLAIQVVSRVDPYLGAELTVRDLFEAPSVRGFAQRIAEALGEEEAEEAARLVLEIAGMSDEEAAALAKAEESRDAKPPARAPGEDPEEVR